MKKLTLFLVIWLVVMVGYGLVTDWKGRNLGSVTVGNEYTATTTPWFQNWTDQVIDKGPGTLGSVIITKAGDVAFNLMDATSTESYQADKGGKATSTRTLASFPASTAAGVYVLDVNYNLGLFIDVISGTLGTSTITFR